MQKLLNASPEEEPEGILILVRGVSDLEKPQYAYACVPLHKYEAFLAAQERGDYNLSDYGIILYYGAGAEPPEHVRQTMEEKYGAAHDFEEKLMEACQQHKEDFIFFTEEKTDP